MRRWVAVLWHAAFTVIAAVLYFLFVLPRWWELTGETPHALGTAMRILAGALIALAALPVALTWLKARRPEFGTPQLALNLRLWSIIGHILAGVLIIGAALSEIWLSLDTGGQWLFGIYGAAAAIAVLAAGSFHLAYLAEKPPPPPKPLKPKKQRKADAAAAVAAEKPDETDPAPDSGSAADNAADAPTSDADAEATPATVEDEATEVTADATDPGDADAAAAPEAAEASPADETGGEPIDEPAHEPVTVDDEADSPRRRLRNRRPSGKTRRDSGGGVALSD